MAERKTLSCFSRWSSPSISSVFTEHMIEELPVGQRVPGKPAAPGQLEKVEIITPHSLAEVQANEERQGNLLQKTSNDLRNCQKTRSYPDYARSRFEISRNWTILLCFCVTKRKRKSIFMPRTYDVSRLRRNSYQRVDPKQFTIWPRLVHRRLQSQRKIQY